MSRWESLKIGPLDEPEPGEDWERDPDMEPTIELSKKEAKQLYHGMYRTDYFVELPDGSHGQLAIAPSEYNRTLRGKFWVRYNRLKWNVNSKLAEMATPLTRRVDAWLENLDEKTSED